MHARTIIYLVLFLTFLAKPTWAQDPAMDFLIQADAVSKSGDEAELRAIVEDHAVLLGAAVGTLVDIALQVRADDPAGAEENIVFAERLLALTGDRAAAAAVEDYRRWSKTDLERRAAAKAVEAAAQEARDAGNLDLAVERLEAARVELEAVGDRRSLAVLWGSLGVVHWYRNDWDAVRSSYEKALEARRAIGDAILEGRTLNGMGSVNFTTGNLLAAVGWYEKAIAKRRATGDLVGLGTSLGYAANCRLQLGDTEAARALFEESVPVLESTGNAAKLIETLNGVGNLQHQLADYGVAEESYRRALRLAAEHDAPDFVPLLHVNLANTLRFTGRMREALGHLAEASAASEGAPDAGLLATLERERATLHLFLGDQDAAREAVVAATKHGRDSGDPGVQTDVALTTAMVYRELGALDRSLATALEAQRLASEIGDNLRLRDAYVNAAASRKLQGDYPKALEEMQTALQMDRDTGRTRYIAHDEIEIANIQTMSGNPGAARTGFRRAIQMFREGGAADAAWIPVFGMGDTFETDEPDSAVWWYDEALTLMEADRSRWGGASERTGFLSNERGAAYEGIARYYAELHESGRGEEWALRALAVADRAKARGLQEQLNESPAAIASLNEKALDSIRKSLGKKTAVLAYSVGDSASFAWLIDRKGTEQYRLPPRAELRARVRQLRDALARPGAGDGAFREASFALYGGWLEPAEKKLRKFDHLRIVADDALLELPFSLLLRAEAPEQASWSELEWLGDLWSTSYLPALSLASAESEPESRKHGSELLAVGDVRFSQEPPSGSARALAPLPHTADEIQSIAATVGRDRVRLLQGDEATESRLANSLGESTPRVLHLATHGIVDPFEPSLSCVAMTPDAEDDGYWFAGEVLATDLPSELVVLSACETGRGRLERGEGVVGLTRAFLAAGAAEVVASLWAVSDESTARLMDAFYQSMYSSNRSTAESLQRARKALLEDDETAHPFHWAAFTATAAR